MNEEILVLSATIYDFADKDTGEIRQGVTLWAIHLNSAENTNTIGKKPVKYSLPISFREVFVNQPLPALCNMTLTIDFNRMKPVPQKFDDFCPVDLGRDLVGN